MKVFTKETTVMKLSVDNLKITLKNNVDLKTEEVKNQADKNRAELHQEINTKCDQMLRYFLFLKA